MIWSEEEVIKKYNDNPKRSQLNLIADLNGCSNWEVADVLHKNGLALEITYKKPIIKDKSQKRGRPASKPQEFRGIPSSAISKDPEIEKKEDKEMKEIPEFVRVVLEEKEHDLEAKRQFHQDKMNELDAQLKELKSFMEGR